MPEKLTFSLLSDNVSDMKTTTRVFQREFKKMKRIAAEGKTIFIHDATGQDFVFSIKRSPTNPLFGRMPNSVSGDVESPTGETWEANQ
ncbi:MAG: hypothetical protein ABIQ35_10770 [Verrucomicrobiota bacterium]